MHVAVCFIRSRRKASYLTMLSHIEILDSNFAL
jgi:hypothetical protein